MNDPGDKFCKLGDILHREDGPAVEYADGTKEYWLDGFYYSEDDWVYEMFIRRELE